MGYRLRVFLTREQNQTLLNLRTVDVLQKVKDRAELIRLNAHGWDVESLLLILIGLHKQSEKFYIDGKNLV